MKMKLHGLMVRLTHHPEPVEGRPWYLQILRRAKSAEALPFDSPPAGGSLRVSAMPHTSPNGCCAKADNFFDNRRK